MALTISGKPQISNNLTDTTDIKLGALLHDLWRGKFLIAFIAALVVLIGGYYAFFIATPTYRANAVLILESRDQKIVDLEKVIGGLSGDTATVNSEVDVLRSRNLMRKVVLQLDLVTDPEFNADLRPPSMKSHVKSFLGLASKPVLTLTQDHIKERVTDAAIDALIARVTVQNIRQSLVFRIITETQNPEKSARIADAIVELYILNQLEVKFAATDQATAWLTKRVRQLQIDLELAEGRLSAFNAGTNLINPETLRGLERQQKELRERISIAEISTQTAITKQQSLMVANGREAQSDAAGDPRLTRLFQQLSDGPDKALSQAYDTRFTQVSERAALETTRTENQLTALQKSFKDLEYQIQEQSDDLIVMQQLRRESEANKLLYEYFLGRLKETSAQQGIQQADSRVISSAVISQSSSSPRRTMILVLSGILGLLLGSAFVFIRELRKNTFRTAQDLEAFTGLTVLGQIPVVPAGKHKKILDYLNDKPSSTVAEAFRNLRTSMLLSNIDKPPQVIVSCSSLPGEGKTTLAFSLAQNLVGMQKKVLLIEGDIRRRVFDQYLTKIPEKGILAILSKNETLQSVAHFDQRTGADVLVGEVSGMNAADVFSSNKFAALLMEARKQYDIIIIDTPPVLVVPDARIIAQLADALLFSVKWDTTSKSQVEEALHMFETVNLKVSGLVLSQINPKGMKRYGYGYKYGTYSSYGKKYYVN